MSLKLIWMSHELIWMSHKLIQSYITILHTHRCIKNLYEWVTDWSEWVMNLYDLKSCITHTKMRHELVEMSHGLFMNEPWNCMNESRTYMISLTRFHFVTHELIYGWVTNLHMNQSRTWIRVSHEIICKSHKTYVDKSWSYNESRDYIWINHELEYEWVTNLYAEVTNICEWFMVL